MFSIKTNFLLLLAAPIYKKGIAIGQLGHGNTPRWSRGGGMRKGARRDAFGSLLLGC